MPMNDFAAQKEVLFITYDDVIKSTKLFILKKLMEAEYRFGYKDYIDYKKIDSKTDEELTAIITASPYKNILKLLATKLFDYDVTYTDLVMTYPESITSSKLLTFGDALFILMKQKFLSKVYMYTESYDENVHKDIDTIYGMSKITYVTGDFKEVVQDINKENKITSYIINDIDYLQQLIDMNSVAYTNILIGNYGYNYKLNEDKIPILKIDDIDTLKKEKIFKFGMFEPDNSAKFSKN